MVDGQGKETFWIVMILGFSIAALATSDLAKAHIPKMTTEMLAVWMCLGFLFLMFLSFFLLVDFVITINTQKKRKQRPDG